MLDGWVDEWKSESVAQDQCPLPSGESLKSGDNLAGFESSSTIY